MNLRGFIFTTAVSTFGYFILFNRIERNEFDTFILIAFINFLISIYLIHQYKNQPILLFLSALLFHGMALFSLPNYSDDVYRFLWDGHVQQLGISPYEFTPEQIMRNGMSDGYFSSIYNQLNSPHYYSVYPPLNQWLFRLSSFSDNPVNGIYCLKFVMLAGNLLLILSLFLLHKSKHISKAGIFLIVLNPLLILETSGNLHFEAITMAVFLLAIYFWQKNKTIQAGVLAACAVSIKLIPLLFIPFMFMPEKRKELLKFSGVFIITGIIISLPYLNLHILQNMSTSLNLYFQKFEFNASIYFIINSVVGQLSGFNTIAVVGPICALIFITTYFILLYRKRNFATMYNAIFLAILAYYACSTTVHPWYIIYVLIVGVIIQSFTAIVFSMVVLLSYSHYSNASEITNTLLIVLEYSLVLTTYLLENKLKEKLKLF